MVEVASEVYCEIMTVVYMGCVCGCCVGYLQTSSNLKDGRVMNSVTSDQVIFGFNHFRVWVEFNQIGCEFKTSFPFLFKFH